MVLGSPVTDTQTHRHTDTQTGRQDDRQTHTKVTTVGTLSGFQEFFLQPIIKDRPNTGSDAISSDEILRGFFARDESHTREMINAECKCDKSYKSYAPL